LGFDLGGDLLSVLKLVWYGMILSLVDDWNVLDVLDRIDLVLNDG
jgi:hypothetical protein